MSPFARLAPGLRSAAYVAVTPVRQIAVMWRRSIQARVVIGTVVLSTILTLLAGWILLRQVTTGLLESKELTSIAQARSGAVTAQAKLDGAEITDQFDIGPLLKGLVETLAPRDAAREDYSVVIVGPLAPAESDAAATGGSRSSGDIVPEKSIPASLMQKVTGEPGTWWVFTRVVFGDAALDPVPGIAVGSQISVTGTGQRYGLFYVYPLSEQQQSLFVVRGALITTGALLVVLLGVVAWLVTRQVVTPVRLARRIAERLAAGRLEERMHVRGEDDIARLGISFNQMAGSLQRQIRQLEELSRVQQRFVSDVSHELRTPLTTVRMAADVLHDSRLDFDPATARSAELLQAELDRFEGLLTDLLEISRFDAGAAVLDLSRVDLGAVARRVVDDNRALAELRGSVIAVLTPPSTPPQGTSSSTAEVDIRRIERIIRNLVVNAIEYGAGGDIEVRVAGSVDAVALSVRDNGIGLKPGEEILVFNRFWRADPARARTRGGTGLGLSIAAEDAALHAGTLDAWGEPGQGSVFRLTLPKRAGDRPGRSPLPLVPAERSPMPVGAPYARYPHDHRRGDV